jgi:hypothetical protein
MPSICDMSDVSATAFALGGRFDREDCSFFEKCDHRVEKYDMTVPGGAMVDIWYCSIDWKKVGPMILGALILMFLLYRRVKSGVPSFGGGHSSYSAPERGYSKYYKGRK